MARRRMFSLDIVDTDAFLDMPSSAQNLYFALGMRADDEGFVASPKRITSLVSSSADDYKLLVAKGYIIPFESGVCVVRDWKINNYIQSDRRKDTLHTAEKALLLTNGTAAYTLMDTSCIQNASMSDTQDRLGKDRLSKVKRGSRGKQSNKKFIPPTLEDVKAYAAERGSDVDPERFFDYFTAGDWKDSRGNPVRSWKQKFLTWERAQPKALQQVATVCEDDFIPLI